MSITVRLRLQGSTVWDIDVLSAPLHARPPREQSFPDLQARSRAAGVTHVLVADPGAGLIDACGANLSCARRFAGVEGAIPVGGIDLRDPVGALAELDRLADRRDPRLSRGVVRVWPHDATGRAGRRVVAAAVALGFVLLMGGGFRDVESLTADQGADVIFLETHFYQLGDFLVVASEEPGYRSSTRLLNSPDAIERVVGELGASRLLLGSGTPDFELAVPVVRLAHARLTDQERAAVAGGNASDLFAAAGRGVVG
jgi:hypothetical protein